MRADGLLFGFISPLIVEKDWQVTSERKVVLLMMPFLYELLFMNRVKA